MRLLTDALPSPGGFTAFQLARVRQAPGQPIELKKLQGKQINPRVGEARRYKPVSQGLQAITGNSGHRASRQAQNPQPSAKLYDALRIATQGVFYELAAPA
jgi:hypothetical protein